MASERTGRSAEREEPHDTPEEDSYARVEYPCAMGQSVSDLPTDVRERLQRRLDAAPVRLALVFGSYATGEATATSDIDIAVAYTPDAETTDAHLSLVADLSRILGRDDIDVVRLTAVDPRIAVEALDHGDRLVGTSEDVRELRERLEPARERRAAAVQDRIETAERGIEQRLRRRDGEDG